MTSEEQIYQAINAVSQKVNDINKRLDTYTNARVDAVTPYTETKTAYIGDTEVTFYDVPEVNVTIFFDKPYTMEKVADRITVSFEELEEVTEITISIL